MKNRSVLIALAVLCGAQAPAFAQKAAYVAVLVDTDRSLRKLGPAGAAADLMEGLSGSDLAGAWAVSDRGDSLMAMTPMSPGSDKNIALEGLRNTRSKRHTHDLNASLGLAMQHLLAFQNQQAVRAIVLLHGGGNDGGDVSATLSALTGASIPVFAVALGKRSDVPMLASFARGTGGAIYEARSRGDLASHLASILAGIDALRSGRRPAPTATPKTPTPKTAAPAPSPKPKPTGSRTLRCRNKANVTLTIEQVSGRAQIRLRRPIPKPKKGRTPKVAPLFAAIKSTDLKAQKEISAFAADLTLSQCRFSPDHVEVVGCSAESATMYRVTTKAGVQTLLASTLSLRTHRLEESNLDGKTYWVEARLDLGLNDPSKAGGGAGKTGALAIHRFKLSECR